MSTAHRLGVYALLTVGSIYIYTALRGPDGLPSLIAKWQAVRQLQKENALLRQDVERSSQRIQDLKVSRSEQELAIRNRLKKARKGETVFVLTDKPVPKPAEPPVETLSAKPPAAVVPPAESPAESPVKPEPAPPEQEVPPSEPAGR